MDTSEKRFERDIESYLISEKGGYQQFVGQDADGNWVHNRQHDVARCIYMDVLCEFIANTQPKEWAKYVKYYGDKAPDKLYTRLEQTITNQGLIYVLRNGITDMGVKLKVCYFKPESALNETLIELYQSNILGCTRQFQYSTSSTNTIDMVLSVNGIPVVAIELKNQFKGQDVWCAMKQFKKDRSSKEFAFRLDHRFLVYFAVDLNEAWMTTQLKDDATYFMPFNMGSNGAGVTGGAGNPNNENGYDTYYVWEEVLQRDSLLDILHRFISHVKEKEEVTKNGVTKTVTKEKLIFPRYHQYDVVRKVIADVREKGAGTNYLIEHSAGSGKSNSIAWIAYRLASLHNDKDESVFDSVIVVTNRVVLDSQLQDTINSFEHVPGLLECIDDKKHSRDLAEALNDKKRIIICTIQKFLFAYKDIEKFSGRKFAIIVDEAHQGQSGESAKTLRRSLIDIGVAVKNYAEEEGIDESDVDLTDEYINAVIGQGKHENQSFFAFTATPKGESLELFGVHEQSPDGTIIHRPFHVYSMRQAIEEGFILDVLKNYTTIKEAFKLIKVSDDNPELIEGPTSKALFKYYKKHGYTITQKTEMIMTNFLDNCRYQISGKGKAMVVADSRANAVRYYFAIKQYLKDHPEETKGTDVMIAFSGEISLEDLPSEKPYTEATMNVDEDGKYITTDKKFRKAFHSSQYNILVVANKYQTGFDEPLLHTMYVDKKLKDITAVQTLSRLNRTIGGKNSTFVLDFENTEEDIKKAFLPYYETTTMMGDSDINRVYDLRAKIAEFMLYNFEDVQAFIDFMAKHGGLTQSEASIGRLASLLRPVVERYKELSDDDQYTVRDYIRKFNGAYSYITQLVRLHDKELFNEFQYTNNLIRLLPRGRVEIVDIEDKIKLEYGISTSRGTVGDDIKALQELGVEIEVVPSTQKRFSLIGRRFDLPELKTLIDAVESARFIPKEKSAALVEKLGSLTSQHNTEKLVRNVDVENRIKADNEKIYYIMEALNDAINANKKVSFQYFTYNVRKEQKLKYDGYTYVFSPYKLIWNGDYYYVVGYSEKHKGIGSFRVDRIVRCPKILDEDAVQPPKNFDLNVYLNSMFRMYNGQRKQIELVCSNDVMDAIIDKFGKDVSVLANDMKSFRVLVNTSIGSVFYSWVFGFGGRVSIKAPEEVKAEYTKMVFDATKALEE